jgi:hypothetical protein
MLVKNCVGGDIVDVDDEMQTMQVWREKLASAREISIPAEKNGRHLDVLDLEYLERA